MPISSSLTGSGTSQWARVYADVNSHKPREYWDYESHPIEWGLVIAYLNMYIYVYLFWCMSVKC